MTGLASQQIYTHFRNRRIHKAGKSMRSGRPNLDELHENIKLAGDLSWVITDSRDAKHFLSIFIKEGLFGTPTIRTPMAILSSFISKYSLIILYASNVKTNIILQYNIVFWDTNLKNPQHLGFAGSCDL